MPEFLVTIKVPETLFVVTDAENENEAMEESLNLELIGFPIEV